MPDDPLAQPIPPSKLEALASADLDRVAAFLMDLQADPLASNTAEIVETTRSTLTRLAVVLDMLPAGGSRTALTAWLDDLRQRFQTLRPPAND